MPGPPPPKPPAPDAPPSIVRQKIREEAWHARHRITKARTGDSLLDETRSVGYLAGLETAARFLGVETKGLPWSDDAA